jgi:hypothetical protein
MERRRRSEPPETVWFLAFLAAADGIVAVVDGLARTGVAPPVGVALLVVGGLHLLAAYGIWKLESYAYPLGTGVFALGAVTDLLAANPVSAAFSAFNAYLLYRHRGLFR